MKLTPVRKLSSRVAELKDINPNPPRSHGKAIDHYLRLVVEEMLADPRQTINEFNSLRNQVPISLTFF